MVPASSIPQVEIVSLVMNPEGQTERTTAFLGIMLGRERQLLALQHPQEPIGAGRIPQWLIAQGCLFLQKKLRV